MIETRPPIEFDGLDGFDLPEVAAAVGADDRSGADDIRRQVAEWVRVERIGGSRRPRGRRHGGDPGGGAGLAARRAPEVGDEEVWEELTLAVTGKGAGRTTESRSEDEGDEARERSFRIEIVEVKERDLLPLDDALAAKVVELRDVAGAARGRRGSNRLR
ncbi:MAG: hypothetical protein R2991_04075 [Thermoanaerobaculia bacterium]